MKQKEIAGLLGIPIACLMLAFTAPSVANAEEQTSETVVQQSVETLPVSSPVSSSETGQSGSITTSSASSQTSSPASFSGEESKSSENSAGTTVNTESAPDESVSSKASEESPAADASGSTGQETNTVFSDSESDSEISKTDGKDNSSNLNTVKGTAEAEDPDETGETGRSSTDLSDPALRADEPSDESEKSCDADEETLETGDHNDTGEDARETGGSDEADGETDESGIIDDEDNFSDENEVPDNHQSLSQDTVQALRAAGSFEAADTETVGDSVLSENGTESSVSTGVVQNDSESAENSKDSRSDGGSSLPDQEYPIQAEADINIVNTSQQVLSAQTLTKSTALSAPRKNPSAVKVASVGEEEYTSLQSAFDAVVENTSAVVRILADITQETALTIDSGKSITLVGSGLSNRITFTNTRSSGIVVDGGTLTLGDGDSDSYTSIALLDQRTSAGNSALIQVKGGGILTLCKDAAVGRNDTSKGGAYAITVGDESASGSSVPARSYYYGSGGIVTGGTVYISSYGNGAITGGSYSNYNGEALIVSGHLDEISSGESDTTFTTTGTTAYRTISIQGGGRVDRIAGGENSKVLVSNEQGHGIQLWHGGHIGTISDNVKIISRGNNGYDRGYAAIRLYDDGNSAVEEASSIDVIKGGTFVGDNYGLTLTGNSTHTAHVGTISGGYFYGTTNGLNANHYSSIDTISGGEFIGVSSTWRSPEDTITTWGGGGAWNFGSIGEITGGTFTGNDGFVNYGTIGSISDAAFTGKQTTGSGSAGLVNITWTGNTSVDRGVIYIGTIGDISNVTISGANGIYNSGATIQSITNTKISGNYRGVYNIPFWGNGGTIGTIKDSSIDAAAYYGYGIYNAYGKSNNITYQAKIDALDNVTVGGKNASWYGIYNVGEITTIRNSAIKSTNIGIYNTNSGAVGKIESILGTSVIADGQRYCYYGLRNQGEIDKIGAYENTDGTKIRSFFKGTAYAGIQNSGSSAVIRLIEYTTSTGLEYGFRNSSSGKLDVIGNCNVFYATGDSGYGYYNGTSNVTQIEPNLKDSGKAIGTGRYWGAAGSILASNTSVYLNADSNYISYPSYTSSGADANTYYHLSHSTDADIDNAILLPDPYDVTESGEAAYTQEFRYLKKYLTLSYDKNAEAATGTIDSQTENKEDGERLEVAANKYLRAGWIFTGWNTRADGTGTAFIPYKDSDSDTDAITDVGTLSAGDTENMKVILTSGDATLYAQWTPLTLSYDANAPEGSTEGSVDSSSSSKKNGTVTVAANRFARAGWKFTGWNAKSDGTGTAYTIDDVETLTENTTLYAQWVPFTLTYDKNNEDAAGTMANTQSDETTGSITVGENEFTYDDHHSFIGWNTAPDGTGDMVPAGAEPTLTEDVTLYAQWELDDHTVTFHYGNTDESATDPEETNAVAVEKHGRLDEEDIPVPTREGYTFAGWYADEERTIPFDAAVNVTQDTDVYAKWEKVQLPSAPETPQAPQKTEAPQAHEISQKHEAPSKPVPPQKLSYYEKNIASSSEAIDTAAVPKTGDTGAAPWILGTLFSGGGLFGLKRKKKKDK